MPSHEATWLAVLYEALMTDNPRKNPSESARFHGAARTDVGRKRKHNEDTVLCRPDLGLFLVADGMGGHSAGDVASALAADSIERFFEATDVLWDPGNALPEYPDLEPGAARLVLAIRQANDEVVRAARDSADRKGMGTTVVAVHLSADGMIHIAHVGDSRCYRVGVGDIEQVTQDHSFLNDVRWSQPGIGDDVMAGIPKNIITRALGTKESVEAEVRSELTLPGDAYLLCSDGLSGMIPASDMQDVLESIEDPEQACEELIVRANLAGGKDNVSVVVVRIDEREDTLPNAEVPVVDPASAPLRFDQAKDKWVCSQCGHDHIEGTSFCVECGLPFLPRG
jgi:protein phosphatase